MKKLIVALFVVFGMSQVNAQTKEELKALQKEKNDSISVSINLVKYFFIRKVRLFTNLTVFFTVRFPADFILIIPKGL